MQCNHISYTSIKYTSLRCCIMKLDFIKQEYMIERYYFKINMKYDNCHRIFSLNQ